MDAAVGRCAKWDDDDADEHENDDDDDDDEDKDEDDDEDEDSVMAVDMTIIGPPLFGNAAVQRLLLLLPSPMGKATAIG